MQRTDPSRSSAACWRCPFPPSPQRRPRSPTPAPPATTPTPAPAPAAHGRRDVDQAGAGSPRRPRRRRPARRPGQLVRGVVAPYVAGQSVVVRLYDGRKKLAAKAAVIDPVAGTPNGGFLVSLKPRSGRLTVRASHRGHSGSGDDGHEGPAHARASRPPPHPAPAARSCGWSRAAWPACTTSSRAQGLFDASTARAVIAYRKMRGMSRVASVSRGVVRGPARAPRVVQAQVPVARQARRGRPLAQVMALMKGKRVQRIYTVSSGKASTPTVLGRFKVYSRTIGTNALGMVDSSYFIGGYAIHGYASVPGLPGQPRLRPRAGPPNARSIYDWLRIGDRVDVYDFARRGRRRGARGRSARRSRPRRRRWRSA